MNLIEIGLIVGLCGGITAMVFGVRWVIRRSNK